MGQILLVVVAVAVTVVTSGAAAGVLGGVGMGGGITGVLGGASLASIAGGASVAGLSVGGVVAGAIGGAVGSIASQGVGVATGIQDKFSWKSVGMAAISGGIGGGISGTAQGARSFSEGFIRGAVSNAAAQGIGLATGLQNSFSWAGVAAAGVSGGIAADFGAEIGDMFGSVEAIRQAGVGAVSALANAATRSALDGSNFGDNVIASIPDVIGQALGNALGSGLVEAIGAPSHLLANSAYATDGTIMSDAPQYDEIIVKGDKQSFDLFDFVLDVGKPLVEIPFNIAMYGVGFYIGVQDGLVKAARDTVKDVVNIITHPIESAKAVGAAIGSGVDYTKKVFNGEANLLADTGNLFAKGGKGIGNFVTGRISQINSARKDGLFGYFKAGRIVGKDTGQATFHAGATFLSGGGGYAVTKIVVKTTAKQVSKIKGQLAFLKQYEVKVDIGALGANGGNLRIVKKAVNLPSFKKIEVDWGEVTSGHMVGGSRLQSGKKGSIFPKHMTVNDVKAEVKHAYETAKRVSTQVDTVTGVKRVKLVGGNNIEMYLNLSTKVLETAYPLPNYVWKP